MNFSLSQETPPNEVVKKPISTRSILTQHVSRIGVQEFGAHVQSVPQIRSVSRLLARPGPYCHPIEPSPPGSTVQPPSLPQSPMKSTI